MRALYWSLRREVWEYRAIYIAPLIISALLILGFTYAAISHPQDSHIVGKYSAVPFNIVASVIILVGWIVAVMYAADALHVDRRDRSILFWKSMPVSDLETVSAKFFVTLVAIPLAFLVAAAVTQLGMLVGSSTINAARGHDPSALWRVWPMGSQTLVMLYGVFIHVLWFAPLYAWVLLVSAFVRRGVLLCAVLPFVVGAGIEKLAFGSEWLLAALRYRFAGAMNEGFTKSKSYNQAFMDISQLDPARYFSTPNLWLGLVLAALFFALAVRLRRYGEPT